MDNDNQQDFNSPQQMPNKPGFTKAKIVGIVLAIVAVIGVIGFFTLDELRGVRDLTKEELQETN